MMHGGGGEGEWGWGVGVGGGDIMSLWAMCSIQSTYSCACMLIYHFGALIIVASVIGIYWLYSHWLSFICTPARFIMMVFTAGKS